MVILRFARLAVVALVPMALSACGIPDLVAHGVKTYEKNQERGPQQPEAAVQPVRTETVYQPARSEPEPAQPVTVPAREAVGVEPLR